MQRDKKIAEKDRKWFFSAIFYMRCNGSNRLVRQLVSLAIDISNAKSCIYEQRFFRAAKQIAMCFFGVTVLDDNAG